MSASASCASRGSQREKSRSATGKCVWAGGEEPATGRGRVLAATRSGESRCGRLPRSRRVGVPGYAQAAPVALAAVRHQARGSTKPDKLAAPMAWKRASRANLSVAFRRVRGKFGLGDDAGTHAMCPVSGRDAAVRARRSQCARRARRSGGHNLRGPSRKSRNRRSRTVGFFNGHIQIYFPSMLRGRSATTAHLQAFHPRAPRDPRPWRQRRP